MQERRGAARRTGKAIDFFITSDYFPPVSVTGSRCALQCKHCGQRLLQHITPAASPEKLLSVAQRLAAAGARGMLLTGGCNRSGKVPLLEFTDTIRRIKDSTDLIIAAHTGFITGDEALSLARSGIDGIAFDVVGDMATVRRVYGLTASEDEYADSLRAVKDAGIRLFPHVCVGLDFGKLRGELHALEMIRSIEPAAVVITGLMPVAGTAMAGCRPGVGDFIRVVSTALEQFPNTPVVLGCARSAGRDREAIDIAAIDAGVDGIALPTPQAVRYAAANGFNINYYGSCCGIPACEKTRIDGAIPGKRD